MEILLYQPRLTMWAAVYMPTLDVGLRSPHGRWPRILLSPAALMLSPLSDWEIGARLMVDTLTANGQFPTRLTPLDPWRYNVRQIFASVPSPRVICQNSKHLAGRSSGNLGEAYLHPSENLHLVDPIPRRIGLDGASAQGHHLCRSLLEGVRRVPRITVRDSMWVSNCRKYIHTTTRLL